ncbi:MAG: hypothetical protein WC004_02925 [Candidatus Absconditabacterales bacterium]
MIKQVVGIIIASIGIRSLPALAYQTKGFDSYVETAGTIQFSCSSQCTIALGEKGDNSIVKISGLSGNGTVIAGAMTDQLYTLGSQPVAPYMAFSVDSFNNQPIPAQVPIVLVIQGSISTTNGSILFTQANFVDKLSQGWKEFWSDEGQTFYGINLRYGQKINGTSVVTIGYRLFIIALAWLYFKNKLNIKMAIVAAIAIYLVIALRNQVDYSNVTINNIKSYTLAESGSKVYGNLGDYYEFINRVRAAMKLDDGKQKVCKTYTECLQERPFCVHMNAVFMKPCEYTATANQSDYQIYYKKTPAAPFGKKILEFNGSSLYQTK